MKIDLQYAIKKYGGMWVVLDKDLKRVVVSGKRAKTVYESATKKGMKIPYLFKVPTKLTAYIG